MATTMLLGARVRARAAFVLLVAVAALFVWRAAPLITAPFGDSHDGRNGAVWAEGSRAIREHGLIASRVGARTTEGGQTSTYANHPPLIYVETAAAEAVAGQHPWAARLPAFLGSLAAIALLYLLLTECGVDPLPAAAGLAVAFAVPMFLVYGTMLDTPMTSFPFGIGLLLLWRRGSRWTGPVAALTVLAGWQGLLLAGGLAVWRRNRALMIGTAVGVAVLAGWFWWTLGSFHQLALQLSARTGNRSGAHVGAADVLAAQVRYLVGLFPLPVLLVAVPAGMEGVRHRGLRPVMAAGLVASVGYTVVLRDGAFFHDYWDYWWLLPLAVGLAAVASRITDRRWIIAAAAVSVALGALVHTHAEHDIRHGWAAARLVARTKYPETQRVAWYAGMVEPTWLRYETRLPIQEATDLSQIPDGDVIVVEAADGRYAIRHSPGE